MKTFTHCAEKKAKQFLNLLQGYTKGIRMTAILILLLMGVNNVWGDNNVKVYCAIEASDLNCYTLKVNANIGDNGTWRQYTMEKLDETYEGRLIYQATIVAKYGGVDALQFQLYDGNTWKSQKQPYGSWTTSSTFANKLYVYDTNKWSTKTNDPSYTVYFVNKDSWTGTIKAYAWNSDCDKNKDWSGADMTSTGKTYQGKNIYSITINKRYANIIFNNGSSKTGDLTLGSTNIGKMYDGSNWVDYNVDPVVTFKANGGTGSDYTQTVNYNTSTALTANTFTRTGYTFTGWNTKTDGTGTSYTDKQKVTLKANTILYAKWTEKTYAVTISAGNGGTVSPSGSQTIGQVTKTTVTATPNANYEFVNWTTTGGVVVANTSSASTTITATAAGTLTANFRSTATNSLTVAAGAGIASVKGSTDPVTLGSTYAITATPKTGYTFSTWTANPAANATFGSATTANTTVTVKNGSVTVTASATENMSTLTTSNKYDAGDPGYEVPAASVNSIGYETTATITATTDDDYTLTSWTLTNCTRTDGGADNATTITVRSNGDGKAATVTANYTENPYVYFVNTARWTTVNIYAWVSSDDQNKNGNWPGKAMTKETEKISGYDVYKYVMPAGKTYDKIIFNNKVGDNGDQTGDLDWVNGKYYVYSAGQWVDKNEVADLLPKPVIYFKNNPKWKEVYVYFHTGDYWSDADNGGSGSQGLASGRVCKMEKVGETDIYKYDYEASGIVPGNVIAFTEAKQTNHNHFHKTQAVYRTDYNPNMELFIPQATYETKNETKYFNKGLWMKYNSMESGYTITGSMNSWKQDDDKFTSSSHTGYHFDIELSLGGGQTYEFQVKNIKNDWYGKQNTKITATKADLELGISAGNTYNVKLTTTSAGNYIFSIDLTGGKMMVSVEYPLQVNDYRLVYVESAVSGKTPYTKFHPAQSIRYQATGEKKDTVSFYINKTTGKNPAILLQQCTNISGATITWKDVAIQNINGNGGTTPTAALAPAKRAGELYVGGGTDITTNGVYNFTLSQTDGTAKILNEETHPYEGDYYIRTDAADGGWRKYNTNPDNIMTHSQTALTHGGYDYYFCKWLQKGSSVKYVVANDYSYCVSDTLTTDDIVTNINGDLPANANVRFTWNSSTNSLSRAYLAGSGIISDRYLVLVGDANLKDTSGKNFNVSGLKANEVAFEDMGNWLYQLDVKANQNTLVKLTADYNKKTQYFKGSADDTEQLIKGSEKYYTLRLIYDFKTNYLVSGLVGNQTITDNLDLEEVMIVRSHHEEAQTLKISGNGSVTANKAYGVMTFNKSTLNGAGSQHERALYWVSFPFDVKLDEAFGFGNYGEHWIMEYYDGEARAKNGAWVDSDTYWKYITEPKGYTLKAGKGYVLCLDLDLLGNSAEFWNNENTEIALYFPSSEENPIVINNAATQRETIVPEYICTIERDDRDIHDSNWNIIGVPAYTKIAGMTGGGVISYYRYDASKNEYDPAMTSGFNFNTMHAYMVQYAGTINWTEQATSIAALAARKSPTSKDQYTLRLALQQEDAQCDHTFIRLQEDNATAEFDMNYDLCKIINRGANIYSMINNVEVAANVLPMEERVIPLGLDIHETGNYTFAMPDGTDGITAILIDYETGKETNLLLADYTTELREGTNNERFALRVRPNHVATAVETIIDGANGQIQKYIINGALYILNNGQLYDAQGRMVQP